MKVHTKTRPIVALAAVLGLALASLPGLPGAGWAAADSPEEDLGSPMWYEQALEHASETYEFEPGDAVTVPFVPRTGDLTLVNGKPPVSLPAGRASGRSMAQSPSGTVWAEPDTSTHLAAAALASAQAQTSAARVNVLRRQVYGFLPYWESPYSGELNYEVLSTVAYFGVPLWTNGDLGKTSGGSTTTGWAGWTSSWMTNVINNAHANGTRVALTVTQFAWTTEGRAAQVALLSSADARLNAARQIAAAIRDRGADGVNLDFEPIVSGQTANFVTFVRTLRAELDKINPGYELVYCSTGSIGYYDHASLTAAGAADSVWIMGYDFRTGGSSYAGAISPLTSPRSVYDLTQVIGLYKARVSLSKVILGLPWYGIAWSTVSDTPNSTVLSGSGCRPTSVLFAQAASLASQNGRRYDSIEQSAWTAYKLDCGDTDAGGQPMQTWRELYYDDDQSLAVKYDMVNYWNLRGMGIWALGYDHGHPEMVNLVASRFLDDRTPPLTGIVNMPAEQINEGFAVSWRGREDWNGIAGYDVQVSTDGGPFADWLTATTLTGANFQGLSGHNYSFRVRATDGAGNVGPWNATHTYSAVPAYAVGGFIAAQTPITQRATPSATAAAVGTVAAGGVLKIIGGPSVVDSVTWYQVTGPYNEIESIEPQFPGPWVAVTDGITNWALPITPPNTTAVAAGIAAYTVGTPGLMPSGTGLDRGRVFSPDGDGIRDTLPLTWINTVAMDSVTLTIYGEDGQAAGTIPLGSQPAGPQSFTWDGTIDGSAQLPDGRYLLQLTALSGSATYFDPTPPPFDEWQLSTLGAVIDTTPSGTYHAIAPNRVLDTRLSQGLVGPFVAGASRTLPIAGQGEVPANAMAVTANLTVTGATVPGYVRLGSSVTANASTLNFPAGDSRANGVTLGLDPSGSLSALYTSSSGQGTTHLLLDITGYFVPGASGATFMPISPTRIVDSRIKRGLKAPLPARQAVAFDVAGLAGVPVDAVGVTGNLTVTGAGAGGYVTVAPELASGVAPPTSTINFPAGDTRSNNVTLKLSGGKLRVIYWGPASASVNVIFDVTGYFRADLSGATFVPLTPGRVVDSRIKTGFTGPLASGASATFSVIGLASVRTTAVAVVGNLTSTAQTADGWMSVGPARTTSTSTVGFRARDTRANGFMCLLGPGGRLTVTLSNTGGSAHAVVDILGYYR